MARKGDFIVTYTGKHFWPLDPQPEEIDIDDIAHALSIVNRWSGHSPIPYSVAVHSLHVAECCPEHLRLAGLLHDASEAYIADVARPVKKLLTGYQEIEDGIQRAVAQRFDLPSGLVPLPVEVVQADLDMLVTEASVFFPLETWWRTYGGTVVSPARWDAQDMFGDLYSPQPFYAARGRFLSAFELYGGRR